MKSVSSIHYIVSCLGATNFFYLILTAVCEVFAVFFLKSIRKKALQVGVFLSLRYFDRKNRDEEKEQALLPNPSCCSCLAPALCRGLEQGVSFSPLPPLQVLQNWSDAAAEVKVLPGKTLGLC